MKPNRRSRKPHTSSSSSSSKLILEEIIGLTTKNANGLASNTTTSSCVYVAGCVVVVYNVDAAKQSHLMVSHRTPKPLSCVAVSQNGRFIAAAEAGNHPAVLVWDCSTLDFICELTDHLYGVECIAFSPDGEHLVSVGGYIYLWNWRNGVLVTKLKASSSCTAVTSVSFSADAKFVITAGKKHLKFWMIGSSPGTRLNKGTNSLTMHGKPVNLGPQKGSSFTSVTSAILTNKNVNSKQAGDIFYVHALTDEGVLCLLDAGLAIRKSVDLKVDKGYALSASDKLVACACSNGIVRLFTSDNLNYSGSLLYSKPKSFQDETDISYRPSVIEKDFQQGLNLPDAIACQFSMTEKLVVVYGDHTLYIWDIHDIDKATKCCVLVSHSACIWDVKNLCCENMHDPSLACVARGCSGGVSFATCSADGTIRLWDLALQHDLVDYDGGDLLLDTEPLATARLVSAGIFERDTMEASIRTQGFRSMAVSSDGKHLAAGDCDGNLHIYGIQTSDYTCFQGVHDAEILSLSFSLSSDKADSSEEGVNGNYFLASGGRDRIIHLYDVKRNFDLIQSIDDHSAAVTSVKLTCHEIISCSADRSLVFRDFSETDGDQKIFRRQQIASHGTVYDMAIDPTTEFVVTVGQDKKINTFNVASGKLMRSFKQDKDFGDPIKVTMDPSCSYLVCSYSNKSLCVHDSVSGEVVLQVMGHGEVITGVIFLPDCKHIVSVGGDGCIFVWKLPASISSTILQRIKDNPLLISKSLVQPYVFRRVRVSEKLDQQCETNGQDVLIQDSYQFEQKALDKGGLQRTPRFRFSISRLPMWAQSKVSRSEILVNPDFTSSQLQQKKEKLLSPVISDGGEHGSFSREAQTPSGLDLRGNASSCLSSLSGSSPESTKGRTSPMSRETLRFLSRDKNWLNVYTVCFDLNDSPGAKLLTDLKMPIMSTNLSIQNSAQIPCSFGKTHLLMDDEHKARSNNSGFICNDDDQFGKHNTNACHTAVSGHMANQPGLHESGIKMQKVMEVGSCLEKSKDSDLFTQHFSSLSTSFKAERSKSSVRRKYSARFTVRRDYPGDSKKLFDTPVREGGKTLTYGEKTSPCTTSGNPGFQNQEEEHEGNSRTEEVTNSVQNSGHALPLGESTKCLLEEGSWNIKLKETIDQKDRIPEGNNLQERTTACLEALLRLNAAAQNFLNLFTELGTLASDEEISNGSATKLYDEAGRLLPLITGKLNAVAELVQCRKKSSCKSRMVQVPGIEPLLETFAENLSQRVMEMVNKNLQKDPALFSDR